MTPEERIKRAIEVAVQCGGHDGEPHKAWVIDQMVRCLTGCPTETRTAKTRSGQVYSYEALGESDEYIRLIVEAKAGEDGPDTYDWDVGIPPRPTL